MIRQAFLLALNRRPIVTSNSGCGLPRNNNLRCPASPDLWAIMEHFTQALSLVVVCQRSLAAQESADVGDEEETLRQSIRLLRDVYNEVDFAAGVFDGHGRGSRAARNGERVLARRGRAARAAEE
jgi:hypothetical protein